MVKKDSKAIDNEDKKAKKVTQTTAKKTETKKTKDATKTDKKPAKKPVKRAKAKKKMGDRSAKAAAKPQEDKTQAEIIYEEIIKKLKRLAQSTRKKYSLAFQMLKKTPISLITFTVI